MRIVDNRVITGHILDGAIALAKLPDGVLTADAAGRAKMADGFVNSAKVLDGALVKGDLLVDTIRTEVIIPLVTAGFSRAADATGITEAVERRIISADLLQSAKAAYFEASYVWAATADGAIELYDLGGLAVRASFSLVGGETATRARTADILASLVGGNEHVARINVTVAGGAGETAELRAAALVVVVSIS